MARVSRCVLAALVLALASNAAAPANAQPRIIVVPIPVGPRQNIVAGSQHFPFSRAGLRRYLDPLRHQNPEVFAAVDPALSDLERRDRLAKWVGFAGTGLGLAILVAGVVLSVGDESDEVVGTPGLLVLSGGGVAIGAGIAYFVITPSRDDYVEVINLHNRVNQASPLRLSRGALGSPAPRHLHLTLARF